MGEGQIDMPRRDSLVIGLFSRLWRGKGREEKGVEGERSEREKSYLS